MSLRTIPFGCKFENGKPVPHSDESEIVKEIFIQYCAGDSLKAIAENLTQRQIEYIPGKTDWHKARIKRMLENGKYAGEGGYPAIVSKEQFWQQISRKRLPINLSLSQMLISNCSRTTPSAQTAAIPYSAGWILALTSRSLGSAMSAAGQSSWGMMLSRLL